MPYMLAFGVKLILQIVFQTMFLFMVLWMTLFHERWENLRHFMKRNYSPETVIYLSGFLISFAHVVTTLGIGSRSFGLHSYGKSYLFPTRNGPKLAERLLEAVDPEVGDECVSVKHVF